MRILLLLLLSTQAYANGNHDNNSHGDSDAASTSSATADSRADASVGDIIITLPEPGTNAATSFGEIRGGDVSIQNPSDIKIRNTPDARAPYSNSTGPCIVGFSAGLAVPGFGGSLGKGLEDEECTRRQSAQTWSSLGVPAMGLWLMCRSEDMARTETDPEVCDSMVAQMQIEAELANVFPTPTPAVVSGPPPLLLAEVSEEEFEELKSMVMAQQDYIDELEQRPEPEIIYETAEPVVIVEQDVVAEARYSRIRSKLEAIPKVQKVTVEDIENERTQDK